jgi:hypothetical protein
LAAPISDVVLSATVLDPGEASVTPATLTFTPQDWNQEQSLTIAAMDDAVDDGPQTTLLTLRVVDALSPAEYDAVPDQVIAVMVLDDDVSGIVLAHGANATVVSERGPGDAFTVRLASQPSGTVMLRLVVANPDELTSDLDEFTFTPQDWNAPQDVTLQAVDDLIHDGNQEVTVTVSVELDRSSVDYLAVLPATLTVVTVDDDVASLVLGHPGSSTHVEENGGSDTINVSLASQPTGVVVVAIANEDPSQLIASPPLLTFTTSDWSQPQAVALTAIDDARVEGDRTVTVTLHVIDAQTSAGHHRRGIDRPTRWRRPCERDEHGRDRDHARAGRPGVHLGQLERIPTRDPHERA